jgi:hypothetical protein
MSETDERDGGEVLKSLPARRPQRRSARRDGAKTPGAAKRPAAARKPASAGAKPPGGGPKRGAAGAKGTGASAKRGAAGAKGAAAGAKRAAPGAKAPAAKAPGEGRKPAGVRPSAATSAASSTPGQRPAQAPEGIELVGTAIQAAGELAQLGLSLGTKALRGAVSRLPRP